jgi:septal ring factor EnvC (AmiA/AmiB activator)
VGAVAGAGDAHATQAEDTGTHLQELRAHLKSLEKALDESRGERDSVRDELRDTERDIGEQIQTLKQLNRDLNTQTSRLTALQAEKSRQRTQIATQIRHLETEARAAYILGQQEYLKLLLNQENPADVSRVITYHRYLQTARTSHIQAARSALERLATLERQIAQRTQELAALRAQEVDKKRALVDAHAKRTRLLAQLNLRVKNQSQEVDRLRQDEQRLVRLLKELQNVATPAAPPAFPTLDGRFPQQKGKLPLPLQGRLIARYGSPRGGGELRWRGIFLAAPEGRPVRSVFRGRVAYADWLRGFGLLLILEHGDGYMTLYGHNQSLYKGAGDWVDAGQVIANAGSTGGPPEPGLYFEVRHNGDPRDPLEWCRLR